MSRNVRRTKSRKKKPRMLLGFLMGVLLILLAIFLSMRFRTITIEGNSRLSNAEIEDLIFDDFWSRNPLVFMLRERAGVHKDVPFVEKYSVSMDGFSGVTVIVYEKKIVGYINRMGANMYFDQNGYVVESSSEVMENIPGVIGLNLSSIVLGEKLPIQDEDLFHMILSISQYLQNNSIQWNGKEETLVKLMKTIDLDNHRCVTLSVDEVNVYLGNYVDMEEKLLEMSSILPNLSGKKGTLYLDTYDRTGYNKSFVFK